MKKKDIFAVLVTGSFMLFPTFIHASTEEATLTNPEVQTENTTSQTTVDPQTEATETLNAYKNDVDQANISLEEKQAEVDAKQAEINVKQEETDNLKNIADSSYNAEVAEKESALNKAAENLTKASDDLQTAKDEQENLKQDQEKAQADYELKKEEAETSQKDLENAETEADGLTQADVDTAKKTVDKATSDLESAKSDASKKQETYDTALAEYNSATTTESEKQAAYDIASSELASATSTYETALAEYETISQQVTDAGINENTPAEYEAVTSRLEEAQKALTSAKSELASAQSDLSNAQSDLASAQNNLSWAEYQLKMAKDSVDTAQAEVNAAKSDLSAAEAEQEKANQANTAAQADLATAKSNYDTAKANLDTAKATLDAANEAAEKGEDITDSLQKAYDDAVAQYNLGSFGYFQYLAANSSDDITVSDAKKAIQIIQDTDGSTQYRSSTIVGPSTNLGAENDATNLENMKTALEEVVEGNELRETNSLNTLNVTSEIMAIAQKQLNWSKSTIGHSRAYNVGENLAWGYSDPYDGWYYLEKEIYDKYIDEGETLASIKADEEKYSEVGHYLNIIDTTYKTTGYAHVSGSGVLYGVADGQTFNYKTGGVSVADYYASFMNYYNDVKTNITQTKEVLDNALANGGCFTGIPTEAQLKAVQEAQNAYDISFNACMYADSEYTNAQASAVIAANNLTSANEAVDTAYKTLTNANNNLTSAQSTQRLKEEILADVNDALIDANSALTAAQSKADDAQQKVTDEQNNVDEIQKLYDYYASLDLSLLDKLHASNQTLESATTSKTTAETNEADAKIELNAAKATTNDKKSTKDSAEEALTEANTAQTSAQSAYNLANADYTDKNTRFSTLLSAQQVAENATNDLESALEKAENAVSAYEKQQELVEQLEEALITAQTDKDTAQADYDAIIQVNIYEDPNNNEVAAYLEQKAILQNLLSELDDLLAQLDEKQAQYDQAKDDYEAYAAYYDLMTNTPADYSKIDTVTKEFEQLDQNLYEEKGIQDFVNYHVAMDSDLNILEQNKADQYADDLQKLYDALTLKSADYNNLEAAQKKAESVFEDIYTQDSLKKLDEALSADAKGKTIIQQKEVDQVAENILKAINGLQLIDPNTYFADEDLEAVLNTSQTKNVIADAKEKGLSTVVVSVENLQKAADANQSITFKSDKAVATFNADTLRSIVSQVDYDSPNVVISIILEDMDALTDAQKEAVQDLNVAAVVNAKISAKGKLVSQFDGGNISLYIPFTPEQDAENDYKIVFIAPDGKMEDVDSYYQEGYMVGTLEHFSNYLVLKVSEAKAPEEDTVPKKETETKPSIQQTSSTTKTSGTAATQTAGTNTSVNTGATSYLFGLATSLFAALGISKKRKED